MSAEAPVWLFDGVCVFCSRSVAYVLRHERRPTMRFVAIQSAEGQALARHHGIDPYDPESFLFVENGRALAKSDGVLALARHLNGPARLLGLFRVLPQSFRDWLYDRLARNRYQLFGKYDRCIIPDPATRARFALPD